MLNIVKGVYGGLMLFLGRDMDWLFSLGLGLLVGLNLTDFLTPDAPVWMFYGLIGVVGLLSVLPYLVYPEASFIVTGFLFGGYLLSQYGSGLLQAFFGFGLSGPDWLIFFVGAVLGAAALGLTKEWGIMFSTAMTGAFLVTDLFTRLTPLAAALVASGFFIAGSIIQAVIMRVEKSSEP